MIAQESAARTSAQIWAELPEIHHDLARKVVAEWNDKPDDIRGWSKPVALLTTNSWEDLEIYIHPHADPVEGTWFIDLTPLWREV